MVGPSSGTPSVPRDRETGTSRSVVRTRHGDEVHVCSGSEVCPFDGRLSS